MSTYVNLAVFVEVLIVFADIWLIEWLSVLRWSDEHSVFDIDFLGSKMRQIHLSLISILIQVLSLNKRTRLSG